MEEFADWKVKVIQEVDTKIISLNHQIKVHKTNTVLKQDVVIKYLSELTARKVCLSPD